MADHNRTDSTQSGYSLGYNDTLGVSPRSPTSNRASDTLQPPSPALHPASQSRDSLLGFRPASPIPHDIGTSVPDTSPTHLVTVVTDDPANAVDARIIKCEPMTLKMLKGDERKKYDDLTFWPVVLQFWPTVGLIALYLATAGAVVATWLCSGPDRQFHVSSENVHMIARYFPSVLGTITVLLFRQTVRESIRMTPYVNMADQNGTHQPGASPRRSVSGAFFPWQDITITPGVLSLLSLLCQFMASFIVSLKVALLATNVVVDEKTQLPTWTLTVRMYPAIFLVGGYVIMVGYTLIVALKFKGKSTGLKWDPVSIADYVALFARCNALDVFEPLELRHETAARKLLSPDQLFRLGYWYVTKSNNRSVKEIVYGIGISWDANDGAPPTSFDTVASQEHKWYHRLNPFHRPKPVPSPLHTCKGDSTHGCAYGTWPHCEHYPYRHNPGCARWLLVCSILVVWASFVGAIYALIRGWPQRKVGFTLPNKWSIPSNISLHIDNTTTIHFPPPDPTDPKSTFLVYALLFRSAPTYVAGIFTSTIIHWLDLNMRFMQPFRNMFGKSGWFNPAKETDMKNHSSPASETILLAYITVSPLQVPLTAYDNGHYKVSWFSTLNTISPLFPIFVGGLLTVYGNDETVEFSFSLSAYIGILVALFFYSFSLPWAWPHPHRLLPRQFYSLADLMAMCYEANWLSSPHLNIADPDYTPTKRHMESRILLSGDEFLFGRYTGRDKQRHIGFDVAKTRPGDFEAPAPTNRVVWIKPERWRILLGQRAKEYSRAATQYARAATSRMEAGLGYQRIRQEFILRGQDVHGEERELDELRGSGEHMMSGGGGPANAQVNGSSATGAEHSQARNRGAGNTVAFQGFPATP